MPALILIADDYEDNRELLRLILVTEDYEVLEASDGQECVELTLRHLPDLIMIDLSMPKLDGWEVYRALSTNRRTSEIPCVAVSAYAEVERTRALNAGFKGYLSKPFRTGELLETVERLLAENRARLSIAEAASEL
ncbi:MAG: two-component system response regulator [Acidobacteria bacterium]|nr:two-component system response regulator [Acidobacteriota bacterium]